MLLGKLDEVAGAVLIKLKSSASGPDTAKRFSEIEKKVNLLRIFWEAPQHKFIILVFVLAFLNVPNALWRSRGCTGSKETDSEMELHIL